MRVLWLCNICLPAVARQLGLPASPKEGWVTGLATALLAAPAGDISLSVAFPLSTPDLAAAAQSPESTAAAADVLTGTTRIAGALLTWYAFAENTHDPHLYAPILENELAAICDRATPDILHCFGTEYPHTLAACRVFPAKDRILVGIQGLCAVYADAYYADLPERVIRTRTLRDILRHDSIPEQREKYVRRGEMEIEAIRLAGNVTGRTPWDRYYTEQWNPNARYYKMNETLRPEFYEGKTWDVTACEPHTIFLSQSDYPIKGLHYLLLALPELRRAYPDVRVRVAGNSIVRHADLKEKLKLSAYGKYLLRLMREGDVEDCIEFLGPLTAEEMRAEYLRCSLFVCCSAIENSPNSLGEAMLLGVPCVAADVGGISGIFDHEKDGILYQGFKTKKERLLLNTENLKNAIKSMWENPKEMIRYSENARKHAASTHDFLANSAKMTEIYTEINRLASFSATAKAETEEALPKSADEHPAFVFVSNYLNHHQIPFCREMDRLLGGSFAFIQTEPMEEERLRMGWQEAGDLPWLHCSYREYEQCARLIDEAQAVMFGGSDDESPIAGRLRDGKPLIRYSERIYKSGQWKAISPRGLRRKYLDHTRYRNAPVYLLCAGAYVASDFHLIHAYPDKMLKWGYFPETRRYDLTELFTGKSASGEAPTILWAGRFLDWKHPELAVETARYLRERKLDFRMEIIGGGDLGAVVERLINQYGLQEKVTLCGYRTPREVRAAMERADIYLFTSDRQEGWGAVLNEAMNSGCAVVADHLIGAAPYLIRQGENGFRYDDRNREQLFSCTERLVRDAELRRRLGEAAYHTITDTWNAENAARELLKFCFRREFLHTELPEGMTREEIERIPADGPCSIAPVLGEKYAE